MASQPLDAAERRAAVEDGLAESEAHAARGDQVAAERRLRLLARDHAGDAAVWLILCRFLRARHRREEAVDPARRAIVLRPDDDEATEQMVRVLIGGERPVETKRIVHRLVVQRPTSAEAWLSRAGTLSDASEKAARRTALTLATQHAGDKPSVLWAVAIQRFVDGDGSAARRTIERYLDAVAGAPVTDQDGLQHYLRLLLMDGKVEEAVRRTEKLAAPIDMDALRARHISRMLAAMEVDDTPESKPHLIVSVPVWGAAHTDFWIAYGLSSVLEPENRRALAGRTVEFQIATTPESIARLEASKPFQMLQEVAQIRFIDVSQALAEPIAEKGYFVLTVAWWAALLHARQVGADLMVLVGDYVISRGGLGHALAPLESGEVDAAFTLDLPTANRSRTALEPHRRPDGTLSVPAAALGAAFLGAPSSRIDPYLVAEDGADLPSEPSRLNVRHADGIEVRTLQPQLFLARAPLLAALEPASLAALDNGFADWALAAAGDTARLRLLADTEHFVCAAVDLDGEERVAAGQFAARVPTATPMRDLAALLWRRGYLTAARKWALGHAALVTETGPARRPGFLDVLADRLPVPPDDLYQRFARRILRPAWAAHVKRRYRA